MSLKTSSSGTKGKDGKKISKKSKEKKAEAEAVTQRTVIRSTMRSVLQGAPDNAETERTHIKTRRSVLQGAPETPTAAPSAASPAAAPTTATAVAKEKDKTAPPVDKEKETPSSAAGPVQYNRDSALPVAEWVKTIKDGGVPMLLAEYKALKRMNSGIAKKTKKAFEAHPLKNRYKDVGCWDQSRVKLGSDGEGYIHANYVDGAMKPRQFIATQGPIEDVPGQFETTIPDFWNMVWEQNVGVIIMLCCVVESDKAKCAQYWPEKVGERQEWGGVSVENKDFGERHIEDHQIGVTTLELLKDGFTNTRSVVHFLHSNWPDRKCPPSAYPIVEFVIRCHTAQKRACENNDVPPEESPMVVHCSAGIGRSGTFLAVDIALGLINRHGAVDIKELVRLIRTQRHFAVQTPIQYVCIYQAILDYLVKHKGIDFDIKTFAKAVAKIKQ